jgi:hypothetical protein
MQTVRTAKWRISNRNGVNSQVRDPHKGWLAITHQNQQGKPFPFGRLDRLSLIVDWPFLIPGSALPLNPPNP